MIVDAHLDIGWNALADGRGFLGPPAPRYLISRSSLAGAGVGLVFATMYTAPAQARRAMQTRYVYENAREAHLMARSQLNYYRACELQLIRDSKELDRYVRGWKRGQVAAVLLMEGADPIETPAQLGAWSDFGLRIVGPAWSRTRYSGGTRAPGGLTKLGVQLLKAMRRKRMILDLSHMADQAVADAFELWRGPIIASHSNARALVPGDRQITDATAAEIARRGGIVGISFYPSHLRAKGKTSLADVVRHAVHHARATGGPEYVGIGTDLDGGIDNRYGPMKDLAELKDLRGMLRQHFTAAQVDGIMGENWIAFLRRSLPGLPATRGGPAALLRRGRGELRTK
jgi:membrane dipeptidase